MQLDAIGYITHVKCTECGEPFPVFTFSADTDMLTNGFASLTNIKTKDIAVVSAAPSESTASLVARTGAEYRASTITFTPHDNAAGVSFQEFRKASRPPSIAYSCIYCSGSAEAVGEEAVSAFETHSKIVVHQR